MTRSILGSTAFSAIVALGLCFGVREAMASPGAADARPYCRDTAHCQSICNDQYPDLEEPAALCSGHTCYCYPS
jgi:hypothetical protein